MIKFLIKYCTTVVAFLLINSSGLVAQNKVDIVKTAYIGKFANYIQWPYDSTDKVFTILVLDDNELCGIIKNAFETQKLQNKLVEVICKNTIDPAKEVDLLLLSGSKVKDLEKALEYCKSNHCLLVTEADDFGKRGAHINFYLTTEETLHFEINKTKIDTDGFEVDFLLLDFAKVIK